MMRIALLGYGKMGKTIEKIAVEKGHEIALKIDHDNLGDIERLNSQTAEVAIEFTQPDSAFENIKKCIAAGVPVVSGTTGWLERKSEIEAYCREKDGTFFYASNFSVGVNIFFKLNRYLARVMARYPEYDISLEEIHHTEKKDAPSGTAITLAEGIIQHVPRVEKWIHPPESSIDGINITAKRIDQVPGTHTVTYDSAIDGIEIKHTAHTRAGFASGALMVAEWARDKKGVLTMDDFMNI